MATVRLPRAMVWLGCAALWVCLAGAGCNLFRPADPEAPNADAILPDYSSPEATLDMLSRAIHDKARTNGSSVYIGAFAESTSSNTPAYHQFFWPSDIDNCASCGGVAPDWGLTLERDFYNRFVGLRGDEYELIWALDEFHDDDERETRYEIHRHYEVITETSDGTVTGALAKGFADLIMIKGLDGNWRITVWNDRVDPDADPGADEITLGRRRLGAP